MNNLEHLVENGLGILENGYSSEEWFNRMSADINWEYVENITVDDLWEICQYVFYTWSKILIDSAPTIDAVSEWIPCSERLPSESEQDNELGVLVTLGNGYSGIQFDWVRDGEHWYDWDGYVIAWMPLPKPYGEREGE